ncbi:hypothetical protein OpiT1DRAFT_02352 [Opitutaceae bacterium TAV1]|nr:hypothetical protein OpiT1DRAFT_02352 [Opitutaceae bacterium TAV1]
MKGKEPAGRHSVMPGRGFEAEVYPDIPGTDLGDVFEIADRILVGRKDIAIE